MFHDYMVQEFCLIGSQTLGLLRPVPIRYVKEDSSDNTVRTSAGNLNFNYLPVTPKPRAFKLGVRSLERLIKKRLNDEQFNDTCYGYATDRLADKRMPVPFAVVYETAHYGDDIGIVSGKKNRAAVMPLIKAALSTRYGEAAYRKTGERFASAMAKTFERAAKLKSNLIEWDKHSQYEGHAQLVFRLRDQNGNAVEHFDINIRSVQANPDQPRLERMIEDHHGNKKDKGAITFYLRTQEFVKRSKSWRDLLESVAPVSVEITGHEPGSDEIAYVPINIELDQTEVNAVLQSFRTTIIDVTLARLPSNRVFAIEPG